MVVIDLHWIIMSGCFCRKDLTSLKITVPVDETVSKKQKDKYPQNLTYICGLKRRTYFSKYILIFYMQYFLLMTQQVHANDKILVTKVKPMYLPVCTLSPVCRSDIVTDLPFFRVILAVDGKQPPPRGGGGVGTRV